MALAMSRPWKHPKTGIYWLRKRVPEDLRAAIGKSEEKFSLKTHDAAEAKRLHAAALADIEERWTNLRAPTHKLDISELQRISEEAHQRVVKHGHIPGINWDIEVADHLWEGDWGAPKIDDVLAINFVAQGIEQTMHENWCRQAAEECIAHRGLKVHDEDRLRIAKAIGSGIQRAALLLRRHARGDYSDEAVVAPPTVMSVPPLSSRGDAAVSFKSLLEGWAAEKRPSEKTTYSWTRVLNQLADFIGHNDAVRLTQADLLRWKASMVEGGLRTKTIRDSKVAPLRAILQWGVDNGKLAANPASRIVVDVRAKTSERIRGFTDEEAAQILGAAAKEQDPVKRWVPLLCAYTGARLSEICQLRRQDIFQRSGLWCMKFDPDAGSLKNENSERAVPLHPAIETEGFLQFVSATKPGPLFSNLSMDRFGNRGGSGTKIIGRWVRGLGLADERLSPSHSWRHRFKTLGRRHGLMPDIVNAITGHHKKTVADSYGEFPIEALHRELLKIPTLKNE